MIFDSLTRRIRQLANLSRRTEVSSELRWALVYGLPRSGTTYTLRQLKLISRRLCGDWELQEFRPLLERAEERDHVSLATDNVNRCLKRITLQSAPPGFGCKYDLALKQHSISREDYEFFKKLFGGCPEKRLFLYREPEGWVASAKEKFGWDESMALDRYKSVLSTYFQIGGVAIEYGPRLPKKIVQHTAVDKSSIEPWDPQDRADNTVTGNFQHAYMEFVNRLDREGA